MAKTDHLNLYAEGWGKGDANIIMKSLDNGFQLDDPNGGMISKSAFLAYFSGFQAQVQSIRGQSSDPFMEFSEIVTQEEGSVLTAWVWWIVPGTPFQGSGLVKVGDNGILSERLAFYTKLPDA